jgi:hypothetical protein
MRLSRHNVLIPVGLLLAIGAMFPAAATKQKYEPRPALRIRVVDILPGLEDVVGLKTAIGAYVVEGMRPPEPPPSVGFPPDLVLLHDLIIGVEGQPVRSSHDLFGLLAATRPGDEVAIKVIRDGKERTLRIAVGSELPAIYLPAATCPALTEGPYAPDLLTRLFSVVPMFGIAPSSPGTICRFVVEACSPLQFEKQTNTRTLVQINKLTHEILGDWRAHTHLDVSECLKEKATLEARQPSDHR